MDSETPEERESACDRVTFSLWPRFSFVISSLYSFHTCHHYVCCSMLQKTASDRTGARRHLFKEHNIMILYRPRWAFQSLKAHCICTALIACVHAACLPALLEEVLLAQARPTMSCIALALARLCNWNTPETL